MIRSLKHLHLSDFEGTYNGVAYRPLGLEPSACLALPHFLHGLLQFEYFCGLPLPLAVQGLWDVDLSQVGMQKPSILPSLCGSWVHGFMV